MIEKRFNDKIFTIDSVELLKIPTAILYAKGIVTNVMYKIFIPREIIEYDYDLLDIKELNIILKIVEKEIDYYRSCERYCETFCENNLYRRDYNMMKQFSNWYLNDFDVKFRDYKIDEFMNYRLTHYEKHIKENDCYETLKTIKNKIDSKIEPKINLDNKPPKFKNYYTTYYYGGIQKRSATKGEYMVEQTKNIILIVITVLSIIVIILFIFGMEPY